MLGNHSMQTSGNTSVHSLYLYGLRTAAIAASFVGGAILQRLLSKRLSPGEPNIDYPRLQNFFLLAYGATVLGYIFWATVCYTHGVGLAQVISILRGDPGASYEIRDLGVTVPGMTTATQFGMAAAIFGAILWSRRPSPRLAIMLMLLIAMAMVRSLLWSERTATIEIVVPILVTIFGRRDWNTRPLIRRLIFLGPLLGGAFLYLYFTASESVRSWGHYAGTGSSIWYFSWMRLGGYYITALNNGALMYKTSGTLPFPYTVFESFWKFPGMNLVLPYGDTFSVDPYAYLDSLKAMANPEFNNPSGVFPYVLDFGRIGACAFFFLAGWVCSAIYAAFRRGGLVGLLCFPLVFISILEVSRIPYATSSRTLPSWVLLFLGCFLLKRTPRRRRLAELRTARRLQPEPAS